ncbi:MAG: HAMP domain-containing histidine kinase [Candidatus Azobacteroides sp.]|nr:HAMP domain-containing histidine kinase [Candidatus Azobacteroides sp.]
MKFLSYINIKLSLFLFIVAGVWSIFFYFAIEREIRDETDDMLESYRDIFVKKALVNPEILNIPYETVFDRYSIRALSESEAKGYKNKWYDAEAYFPEGDEHIPIRIFKSVFRASDDKYYELEISMSTLERDDMLEAIFIYIVVLYILLMVCITLVNLVILKKSFFPVRKLLIWINSLVPGKPLPPLNNKTNITEFSQLNDAAWTMSQRNLRIYEQQKEFIENASHELQTPLAVALNKVELFSQHPELNEKKLEELEQIYSTLQRAIKLNKSLLLLSRVENRQYPEEKEINLNKIIKNTVEDLKEVYGNKNIQVDIQEENKCVVLMNDILAHVLITNLLKNAFLYTPVHGVIEIILRKNCFLVKNSGEKSLDKERMFHRFYHSSDHNSKDSTGLGLSILKSICNLYQIGLSYSFREGHIFLLKFTK